jgi:hypothetical protein
MKLGKQKFRTKLLTAAGASWPAALWARSKCQKFGVQVRRVSQTEVIGKSADLLRNNKTNFALDTCHLKPDGKSTHSDVETLFRSYGYEAASEANQLMATWARPLAPAAR